MYILTNHNIILGSVWNHVCWRQQHRYITYPMMSWSYPHDVQLNVPSLPVQSWFLHIFAGWLSIYFLVFLVVSIMAINGSYGHVHVHVVITISASKKSLRFSMIPDVYHHFWWKTSASSAGWNPSCPSCRGLPYTVSACCLCVSSLVYLMLPSDRPGAPMEINLNGWEEWRCWHHWYDDI